MKKGHNELLLFFIIAVVVDIGVTKEPVLALL